MRNEIVLAAVGDAFAAAALDDALWMPALQALADATGSNRAQLVGIGGSANIPFNWVTGFPEKALREFVEIDGGSPAVNPRVAASQRAAVMEVVHEDDYDRVMPDIHGDIYADFARDNDIPFGCQSALQVDRHGLIGLAVLRTASDGRTTPEQRRMFAGIAGHARAAVRIQSALEHRGAALVAGAFETLDAAVFVLDGLGRVAAYTPAAQRLLSCGRLRIADDRLAAAPRADGVALDHAVRRMLDTGDQPMTSLLLRGGPDDEMLVVDVSRLPRQPWSLGYRPSLLLVLRGSGRLHAARFDLLRDAHGLSRAEADIVLRLAAGDDRESIAAARGVSVQTVRTQLKTIFAKIGVRREVDLVIRLAPLLHSTF
ncbi:helix-turn-helix transcriptional regulator [Sphingomonas sp. 1P06PA]|uniref:helix-turn-helix transcriptional regulator n=1 Tax=Sphingomonas sp. 1P06PA TaxID=554121 RepID=UPI0039A4B2CF